METYTIQRWLFDSAFGRFEFDLAKSGIAYRLVGDVDIDPRWALDYAPDRGLPETRAAIADMYGGGCTAERVIVGNGAQEVLYLVYRCLLEARDQVVTFAPGWQQSWAVPADIGCTVAKLRWPPSEPLDLDALEAATGPATKLIVVTSPGNPSGRRLTADEWRAVTDIADAAGSWLVCDEEFAVEFGNSAIHGFERALSVSSLSKTYGVAGLRVGWAAVASEAGTELIERMVNYKRYTTMCNSALSERIATALIADHERQAERYADALRRGRVRLDRFASTANHLSLVAPQSTPFAWLNLRPSLDMSSMELAELLLERERVLVMPAEVFDFERGLRLTYARPDDVLEEGLLRFERVLAAA
jgi:aspartate/methionine/tyrosine aminotransferase